MLALLLTSWIVFRFSSSNSLFYRSNALSTHSLTWNHRAETETKAAALRRKSKKRVTAGTGKDGGTNFGTIIFKFAKEKRLNQTKLLLSTIKRREYDKAKLKYCLELADVVMTEEQKEDLFSNDTSKVKNATVSITTACMMNLEDYNKQK